MTVSSLAKKIIGVNNIVVENIDLETTAKGEQLVIMAVAPSVQESLLGVFACELGFCRAHDYKSGKGSVGGT